MNNYNALLSGRRYNLSRIKEKKEKKVEELVSRLVRAKSVILTDFQGLTVTEISELRKQMKESGSEYKVCKNSLLWIALQEAPFKDILKDSLKGPTGIVFGYDDPVLAVKKTLEFSEKNEKLKLKQAVLEGRIYSPEELKEIAKLPSKNVLMGMLFSGMIFPLSKMVSAFKAVNLKLLYLLEALKNKKAQ